MDTAAPERTETSNGRRAAPNLSPVAFSKLGDAFGQRLPQCHLVCRLGAVTPCRGQNESGRHGKTNLRHAHQVPGLIAYFRRAALRRRNPGEDGIKSAIDHILKHVLAQD